MAFQSTRETWQETLLWTSSLCWRGDGTPVGTRVLDLISRMLFRISGMTTGRPSDFRRATWDSITATQIAAPSDNERGISSYDGAVPSHCEDCPTSIPCRFYEPAGTTLGDDHDRPTLVFYHGGGFCIQSAQQKSAHDLVVGLCARLGCRGVSVGYRLAPEHPFPCGLQDSYAVLRHLHDTRPHTTFILAGDSAGGNLALVCALLALHVLDANLQPDPTSTGLSYRIAHILLLYPALFEFDTPSERCSGNKYLLPSGTRDFFFQSYLGTDQVLCRSLLQDWRVAPLRASLSGLPSTTVLSCNLDPLSDSNLMLVRALTAAQVPVKHMHVVGAPHGFLTFPWFASDKRKVAKAWDDIESAVKPSIKSRL